jgi:hypothetical protein
MSNWQYFEKYFCLQTCFIYCVILRRNFLSFYFFHIWKKDIRNILWFMKWNKHFEYVVITDLLTIYAVFNIVNIFDWLKKNIRKKKTMDRAYILNVLAFILWLLLKEFNLVYSEGIDLTRKYHIRIIYWQYFF